MDLDEIFNSKNISQSSKNLYKRNLLSLNDGNPIKSINFLKDPSVIDSKLERYKPNTRRSFYIAIVSFLRCLKDIGKKKSVIALYEKYMPILDEMNKKLKDATAMKPKEEQAWMDKSEIDAIYERLSMIVPIAEKKRQLTRHQFQDLQRLMLMALYTKQAPRRNRDYQLMFVVMKKGGYDKELLSKANILDMANKQFLFSQYKTAGSYNVQSQDIPEEILKVLKLYLKHHPNKGCKDPFRLLVDHDGHPLNNNNDVTRILYKIFGRKIGSSMLRKMYLTNKYGAMVNELEKDVSAMGTSVETAKDNYIKDV